MVVWVKFCGVNKCVFWLLVGKVSWVLEVGEDLELQMGENWCCIGVILVVMQLDDGQLLVQVVMNNDLEVESVFCVCDDVNILYIVLLFYLLEE